MQFERKNIRLPSGSYVGQGTYFVTICCLNRRPVFVEPSICEWLVQHLRQLASQHGFSVHAFCIMPDHVHMLVGGAHAECNLLTFINALKQRTAYEYKKRTQRSLWQFKFYDHILRPKDSAEQVAWYIWLNPVRKGLCEQPEDYLHSGSFTLEWKRKNRVNLVWIPPWKKTKMPSKDKMPG